MTMPKQIMAKKNGRERNPLAIIIVFQLLYAGRDHCTKEP